MMSKTHPEAQCQTPGWWLRAAWLPVPLFLAATAILFFLDPGRSYEQPRLLMVLNFVCSALPAAFVAYLFAQSFLVRGSPGLLLLGGGVLLWGTAGIVGVAAGLVEPPGPDANVAITIHNSCVWFSAVCQLAGAALLLYPQRAMRTPGLWLLAACAIAVVLVGLLTLATLGAWTPTFFVQGQGGTPLRQFVLGSGTGMFVLTSVLLWLTGRRTASAFVHWFSPALALVAVGLLGVMGQSVQGGILGWTGRAAQYLGSVYMLVAAIVSTRESRVWGIPLEEALSEVRQQYRALVEMSPDAIAVHAGGRWVFVNPAAVRLFGATRAEEILGREALDLIHPDDREATPVRTLLMAQEGQTAPAGEFRARRLDGECVDVESSFSQIAFQGRPAVLVVLRDISERKRAEKALAESEAKYRNLFENMTEEVHFWQLVRDENGRIKTWRLVDANPPTLKTWGRTLAEIQGKTTDEIFGSGATEHYMPVVQKIMTDGVPHAFEDYFPNLDKYFRFTSVPLGEYFITTGADITRHKRAEGELRKSSEALQAANVSLRDSRRAALNLMEDALAARERAERASDELRKEVAQRKHAEEAAEEARAHAVNERNRLEAVMRTLPVGVALIDAQGGNIDTNIAYEQVWGGPRPAARTVADYAAYKAWWPDTGQPVRPEEWASAQAVQLKRPAVGQLMQIERFDGTRAFVLNSAAPILDAEGEVVGAAVTIQNITALKEAEERLTASLHEKEVLLKEVHHRVKNNLQVIASLVSLQADGLDDPRLRDLFRDVHDRVRSMALVHERLYQSESLARVDFGEYARSLLSHLWRAHATAAARIQLRLDLEPVPLSVEVAVPCGLILNELAGNALKHAFAGRAAGDVTVTLHTEPDGRVRLGVSDNGVGLPEGLDWRQSRSLGLRLVQMLAAQINGAVEMQSGAGTEFAITFTPPGAPGDATERRHEAGEGRP